jgi:acetyltransferase EpsM
MSAPRPVVILGTSTFATEVADLVGQAGGLTVAAFAQDEDCGRRGEAINNLPVVWVGDLGELAGTHVAVSAQVVTPLRRRFVLAAQRAGLELVTVRHPSAVVSPSAEVGAGCVLGPGCIVAARARIGEHGLLNRGALIGHHAQLADYVTVSPGANLAGGVRVGVGAYIGMSASVLDGRAVGAHAVVGAGAVVTRDVAERVQVLGVPAREVRRA